MISKKIAGQHPDTQGKPKKVGDTLQIGGKPFQIVGLYETGSMILDVIIIMDIDLNSASCFPVAIATGDLHHGSFVISLFALRYSPDCHVPVSTCPWRRANSEKPIAVYLCSLPKALISTSTPAGSSSFSNTS